MSIRRIRGDIRRERGMKNEKRVLDACKLLKRPIWMLSARPSNHEEDHKGIDIVIESDMGRLYVQVKSSYTGKEKFEKKHPRAKIAIVVVRDNDTEMLLLDKIVQELEKLRAEFRR